MKQISLCLFFSTLLFASSLLEARDAWVKGFDPSLVPILPEIRDLRVNGIDPRSRLEMCLHPTKDQQSTFSWSSTNGVFFPLTREQCEEEVATLETVESIVMKPGRVRDLSPLKELPKLKRLSLTELALKDITPLKTLTNLENCRYARTVWCLLSRCEG